jgi:phosphoserine phosphatase RsbX
LPDTDGYLLKRSLMVAEDECGDTGLIVQQETHCFFALVDVLGHGREAHQIALQAEAYLTAQAEEELVPLMKGLDRTLRGSRGAVAALCRLDTSSGQLYHVGVGNITTRIFGTENQRLLPRDGIVGYMMPSPREQSVRLAPGDVVMLYSDGIKESFDPYDCPGLLSGSAENIAKKLFHCFYKGDDDGSCLILRYVI